MATIQNPLDVITVNVDPGSTVDAEEGYGINLNTGALATTSGSTVAVGVLITPLTDGAPKYGRATGSNVEAAVGKVLVRISSADVNDAETFNTTNYGIGDEVGFTSGKYDYNAADARGVVVDNISIGGTFTYADVLIDKVLG